MAKQTFNQSASGNGHASSSGWERTHMGGNISREHTVESVSADLRANKERAALWRFAKKLSRYGL